ncbi:MAG: phosphatidate cytidylyltransferase [Syntrophobacteraceae bacterium]
MQNWREWSSHKQRLATGGLLAVPLMATLSFGPMWSWLLLVALVGSLGLWELQRLFFPDGLPVKWQVFHICVGLLFPAAAFAGGPGGLLGALLAAVLSGLVFILLHSPLDANGVNRIALLTLGWVYVPFNLSYALLLGSGSQGRAWVYFIIFLIAAGDIGAYYSGRKWGRIRLYPDVSPKKTVEGSIGGALASVATGVLFGMAFLGGPKPVEFLLLSLILAIVGQVGDLIESMIKRVSGRKDSSRMLPGHGGILDRLDSLLFVFPSTWCFLQWLAK